MPLVELESALTRLYSWAQANSVRVEPGIVELSDAFPHITVVGFEPDDIALFLTLASSLPPTVLALDAPPLHEEDLLLVTALAGNVADLPDRARLKKLVAEARTHLGKVHEIRAVATGAGVKRAVVFSSATDWGANLFGLSRELADDS